MNWLISANSKVYDHALSFEHHGHIDWRQGRNKYKVGDIVYIYCTRPLKRIRYKCRIDALDLKFNEIRTDKEYWKDQTEFEKSQSGNYMHLTLIEQVDLDSLSYVNLLKNGLSSAPQGPRRLEGDLLQYVEFNFDDNLQSHIYPDMINDEIFEGLKKTITVNKYERSSIARKKCIEVHGCTCQICGINFKNKYGDIGEGFIHVHHIVPVHSIGKEYKVNYKK